MGSSMSQKFDVAIIGAGIGGLFTGALLASRGKRVYLTERHSVPGGYGQSFERSRHRNKYVFCAHLHYLWNCLPGYSGHRFFEETGLAEHIQFVRLNPNGFDVLRAPDLTYHCRTNFESNLPELARIFPECERNLKEYFGILTRINDELLTLPAVFNRFRIAAKPLRYRYLIRFQNWTLQRLWDHFAFPNRLQLILGGQLGNVMVPPSRASLIMFAGMVTGYYTSACVPTVTYQEMFQRIVQFIASRPGCKVSFDNAVTQLEAKGSAIGAMHTAKDGAAQAEHYIFNGDPERLRALVSPWRVPSSYNEKLSYTYSPGSFVLYLGLKDVDLRAHGFGNWNTWHFGKTNLEQIFADQVIHHDYSSLSLFISTPTLHHDYLDRIAPPGHAQLICATMASYDHWLALKKQGRAIYTRAKKAFAESIYDILERHYIKNIRDKIDVAVTASPLTNERYVGSPFGNAYGADLTPANWNADKLGPKTPFSNLFLVGATAGIPSFAGGLHASYQLAELLAPGAENRFHLPVAS